MREKRVRKKIIILSLTVVFVATILTGCFSFLSCENVRFGFLNGCGSQVDSSDAESTIPTTVNIGGRQVEIEPLSINPLNTNQSDTTWGQTRPYDIIDRPLYTRNGRRVFYERNTGMLFDADGNPIAMGQAGDSPHRESTAVTGIHGSDSGILYFFPDVNSFVDSANRNLEIVLNSRLDRHYLRIGNNMRYATSIILDREVFLINIRSYPGSSNSRLIWTFREFVRRDISEVWWRPVTGWGDNRYKPAFFDLNGHAIRPELVTEMVQPVWWHTVLGIYWSAVFFPPLIVDVAYTNVHGIPLVEILNDSRVMLRDLMEEISQATVHPWPRLYERINFTYFPVFTECGGRIMINPRTRQLTDWYGFALFSASTGLPVILFNNRVITTADYEHLLTLNFPITLKNVVTVQQLLELGILFYKDTITTAFGTFTVPVLRCGITGNYYFVNQENGVPQRGDEATGTDGIQPWANLNGRTFYEWWGEQGRAQARTWLLIIGLLLGGLVLFVILGIVLFYFGPFLMPWAKMGKKALVHAKSGIDASADKLNKKIDSAKKKFDDGETRGWFN